jgi:hypothetical protein
VAGCAGARGDIHEAVRGHERRAIKVLITTGAT